MNLWGRTLRRGWHCLCLGLGLCAVALGCDAARGPSGPPVLESVEILDASGVPLMPGSTSMPISARVQLVFRFDRLLDPEQLEEIVDGKPVGSEEVAHIEAPGEPAAVVTYIPNGHAKHKLVFSGGPAILVSPSPTLPSGAAILVTLDKERIQSKDGASPYRVAEGVMDAPGFRTLPFAAVIEPVGGASASEPLAAGASLSITFNNLPEEDIANRILVEVFDSAGELLAEVEGKVSADPMDPTHFTVAPAEGSWPAGSTVKISVDEDALDALGMSMPGAIAQTFMVAR